MENEISIIEVNASKKDQNEYSLDLTFKPFEIKTIKIK